MAEPARPRLPADLRGYYNRLSYEVAGVLLVKTGRARYPGFAELTRLLLAHNGQLPTPTTPREVEALDALRLVLQKRAGGGRP